VLTRRQWRNFGLQSGGRARGVVIKWGSVPHSKKWLSGPPSPLPWNYAYGGRDINISSIMAIAIAADDVYSSHVWWRQPAGSDVIVGRKPGSVGDVWPRRRLSRLPAQRVSARRAMSISTSGRPDFRPAWRHCPTVVATWRHLLPRLSERGRVSPWGRLQVRAYELRTSRQLRAAHLTSCLQTCSKNCDPSWMLRVRCITHVRTYYVPVKE